MIAAAHSILLASLHRTALAALIGFLFAIGGTIDARGEARIALVIGNSSYQAVAPLPNPTRDAALVARVLGDAGFRVDLRQDLTVSELRRAVGDFSELARDAEQAVVFYAGHGIEVDGENYLIPVDARLARDFDVEDETVSLSRVLRAIEPARRLRLVLLDACRDSPFAKTMKRTVTSRSIGRGLARIENSASDTLVAFATEAGTIAADGDGEHSPFTAAVARHIVTPGLDVRLAFGRVRDEVMRSTGNKQRPFLYGSLGGETVTLLDSSAIQNGIPEPQPQPQPQVTPTPTPDPCALAQVHWQSAEAIGTLAALEDHLRQFPNCAFSGLAKERITAIRNRTVALPEPEPQPEPQPIRRFHFLVGLDPQGDNWLALRSEPSSKRGKRLMKMGPETLLTVLGQEGKWLRVQLSTGQVGWAHSDYIACCR